MSISNEQLYDEIKELRRNQEGIKEDINIIKQKLAVWKGVSLVASAVIGGLAWLAGLFKGVFVHDVLK